MSIDLILLALVLCAFALKHDVVPKVTRSAAPDRAAFIRRLKTCEERVGNQSMLARKAGIAQSTIRGYTSRGAEPPRDVLVQLAKAADVSILWLATGEGPMETVPSLSPGGMNNPDDIIAEVVVAAAKAYSVPVEFARLRLSGSAEIKALRSALEESNRSHPIPVIIGANQQDSKWPIWGVLSSETLKEAAPLIAAKNLAVFRITTPKLSPRFNAGDWALVDLNPKIIETGIYCVSPASNSNLELRDIIIEPSKPVILSVPKHVEGNFSPQKFTDISSLTKQFRIVGRLVAGIRIVGNKSPAKG